MIHERLGGHAVGENEHDHDEHEVGELVEHAADHEELGTERAHERETVKTAREPEQDVYAQNNSKKQQKIKIKKVSVCFS